MIQSVPERRQRASFYPPSKLTDTCHMQKYFEARPTSPKSTKVFLAVGGCQNAPTQNNWALLKYQGIWELPFYDNLEKLEQQARAAQM